jgi:putative ABC transport system permease protein
VKTRDIISYSFSAIRLRKLRAGLTTLGVVIGIAAIVALLSISQGLQSTITAQLQRGFATDTLIVTAGGGLGLGGGFGAGGESGFKLFVSDVPTITAIRNVDIAVATIQRTGNVTIEGNSEIATIIGVDLTQYNSIYTNSFVVESGTIPANPDNNTVIVGKRIIDPRLNGTVLGEANSPIMITLVNATARPPTTLTLDRNITGVLQQIGSFGLAGPSDSGVYVPLTEAETLFGTNECDTIIVKLKSSDQSVIDSTSKSIKDAFNGEVSVISATAILSIISNVFSVITLFLGGIAAISLVVAGVGIMNIMIVSLMERTREIGILKALGTRSRTVLLIFLSEAVIIGFLGGGIGAGLGWILANVVAVIFRANGGIMGNQAARGTAGMAITPILTPTVLIGAILFGIGVSVIFALYPAWRASRLKPVDALRYE